MRVVHRRYPGSAVKTIRAAGIGWMALVCAACAGASDEDEVTAACIETHRVSCEMFEDCLGGGATRSYGSVETCVERLTSYCVRETHAEGVTSGIDGVEACGAAQRAQTCDEWVGTLTPGCGYSGTQSNGTSCRHHAQCASGFCNYTEDVACGICEEVAREGEACFSACGPLGDVACVRDVSGNRCVRLRGDGEACSAVLACASGFACPVTNGIPSGTCQRVSASLGESCDDTLGPFCDYRRDLYCDPISRSCVLPAVSASCGLMEDGTRSRCRDGTACVAVGPDLSRGTCLRYLPDGASCQLFYGSSPCLPPAVCLREGDASAGRCTIVDAEYCR